VAPRLTRVDLWLGIVVISWALSVIVSKVLLDHGWPPVGYSALRFGLAGALMLPFAGRFGAGAIGVRATLASIGRSPQSIKLLLVCVVALVFNQLGVVFALERGNASVVSLVFGTCPVFTAIVASVAGTERITRVFVVAAAVSISGVALIAFSQGSSGGTGIDAVLLAMLMTLGFAVNSVAAMPLMRTYSAITICAVSFFCVGLVLLVAALPTLDWSEFTSTPWLWTCFAFAVANLILANAFFLKAAHQVGPSHAQLYSNMQPFVAALLAVVLLSESLTGLDLVGGALIVLGVAIAWRQQRARGIVYADEP
jgi:drug/metabolite transporter (DMT)-like permease